MLEGMSMGDLVIYNADGEEQWRLDSIFLSDGDIKISPDGEYVLEMIRYDLHQLPYYLSKEGFNQIKYNSGKEAKKVKAVPVEIDNGFILLVEDTIVVKYNKNGRQEWDIITDRVYNIIGNKESNSLLVNTNSKLLELNKLGKIQRTYYKNDTTYSIAYMMKDKGKCILSWPNQNKISLIDFSKGEVWQKKEISLLGKSWPIRIEQQGDIIIVENIMIQFEPPVGVEGYLYYSLSGEQISKNLSSSSQITTRFFQAGGRLQSIKSYFLNSQFLYLVISKNYMKIKFRM